MIDLPTVWWAHYLGDLAAWSGAALVARWQYKRWPEEARRLEGLAGPGYFLALALGALAGAWLFGWIANPAKGEWTVGVFAKNTFLSAQGFGLAATGAIQRWIV